MAESSGSWDESLYICDVQMDIEIEEREEQLYEEDGKTPVMKSHEAGEVLKDSTVKTRVKLKRYYYRLVVTVTMTALVADGPASIGTAIGDVTTGGGYGINGDSNVKYLCGSERTTRIRDGVWRLYQTWNGFGKWKKVPKSWKMEQTSEEIKETDDEEKPSPSA